MKKIIIMIMSIITLTTAVNAGPHWGHCHGGRGGWGIAAALIGGVVVGSLLNDNTPPPNQVQVVYLNQPQVVYPQATQYVIPQPVIQPTIVQSVVTTETREVWVPGKWILQKMPDGKEINVWVPGHYETQLVQVIK